MGMERIPRNAQGSIMISKIHKNIMGTVSFDGKFDGMRKAHDELVAALTKISDIPCDHGGQDECPREIARAALAKAKEAQS